MHSNRLSAAGRLWLAVLAPIASGLAAPARAAVPDDLSMAAAAELGVAPHGRGDTQAGTLALQLPGHVSPLFGGDTLSFRWELFLSQWQAPSSVQPGRSRTYTQIGAMGVWRHRFDAGRSPWFAEAGIGASLIDQHYRTPSREFATTFQFTEILGAGYSFGEHGRHELSARFQHFSNAGIRKPNRGENFLRLRYAYRF